MLFLALCFVILKVMIHINKSYHRNHLNVSNRTDLLYSAVISDEALSCLVSDEAFIRWFADPTGRQKLNSTQSNFELARNSRGCTQANVCPDLQLLQEVSQHLWN